MSFFQDSDPISDFTIVNRPLALELFLVGDALNKVKKAEDFFSENLQECFAEFKTDAPITEIPFFATFALTMPQGRFLEKEEEKQFRKHFDRVKDIVRAQKNMREAVKKSKKIFALRTLEFFGKEDLLGMRALQFFAARIAKKYKLAVVCRFSNVIFNYDDPALTSFAKFDGEPISLKHLITVYQSGDSRVMTTTVGLNALDLPEFCIENTELETRHCVSYLLHGMTQALIERMYEIGSSTEGPELKLQTKLPLTVSNIQLDRGLANPPEHDPTRPTRLTSIPLKVRSRADGPYFVLDLPANPQIRDRALREIYGEIGLLAPVVNISSSDAEMKAAEKQAKDQWPEARRMFLAKEGQLLIKRAFETGHGDEYMWVDVEEINGPNIRGKIQSLPPVDCRYKQHQVVDTNEKEFMDWIIYTNSGKELGGFTQQVLLKSQSL